MTDRPTTIEEVEGQTGHSWAIPLTVAAALDRRSEDVATDRDAEQHMAATQANKGGARVADCGASLASDSDHCFHWFDDETCCWCEDDCDCHDEDYNAGGVLGVHIEDEGMVELRAQLERA